MFRASNGVAAGIVAGVALLAGTARAQTVTTTTHAPTTSTTTTTTTTTTLLPHPFSPATGACIRKARAEFRQCRSTTTGSSCRPAFETALPNCFKAGAGVSCAKKCTAKEQTCLGSAPTTQQTCRKACKATNKADVRACRQIADGDNLWAGGDASCLSTAQANLDLCHFTCSQAAADCRTALTFCIANCPNQ